jgi:16S rRNA (guanine527-N7)-methyltransferase
MDMGSGGGLPGIPLAILRPEFRIVLVDSIAKKVKAMESMVNELALHNVGVVRARAEDVVRLGLVPDRFDLVLARAVAPLADLVTWSVNAVRRGNETLQWKQSGRTTTVRLPVLMAWKGGDIAGELEAMNRRTGHTGMEFPLVFPGSDESGLEEKKMVIVELHAAGGQR